MPTDQPASPNRRAFKLTAEQILKYAGYALLIAGSAFGFAALLPMLIYGVGEGTVAAAMHGLGVLVGGGAVATPFMTASEWLGRRKEAASYAGNPELQAATRRHANAEAAMTLGFGFTLGFMGLALHLSMLSLFTGAIGSILLTGFVLGPAMVHRLHEKNRLMEASPQPAA